MHQEKGLKSDHDHCSLLEAGTTRVSSKYDGVLMSSDGGSLVSLGSLVLMSSDDGVLVSSDVVRWWGTKAMA